MKTLEFIFDFASPNAYMAHKGLQPLLERTGARLQIVPCLLGGIFKSTGNKAPFVAFGDIKPKMAYEMLEMRRFVAKHGLDRFKMNPHFPLNTVLPQRAALAAQRDGRLDEYVETVLRLTWEDEVKTDDPDALAQGLSAAGFDGAALIAATQEPEIKTALIENTDAAVERGAFGIPTFYVGDEMFFGKDRLDQVEEALAQASA